jgi:protein-S-isoprenylcysteine O-methyltransferase Ste14
MTVRPIQVVGLLWLAWVAYWFVSAGSAKPSRWRESPRSRATHMLPALAAAWLLGLPMLTPAVLRLPFFPWSPALGWLGAAVAAVGLGFSVWARVHLGRNWSGIVTVKEDHELVRSGPYGRVRHPIYTGLIAAFAGTAMVMDQTRALLALVLLTLALVRKLHIEEARMAETFPDYAAYRRETAALFPFIY